MNFVGNFYFKHSYFWLVYIRRCSRCLKFYLLMLLSLWELETVGNCSFSIYIFFGRNWWSCKDLGFCLVLIQTVFFLRGLLAMTLPLRCFLCFPKLDGCNPSSRLDAFWFGGGYLLLVFASLKYFIKLCLAYIISFT